jgi:hypothetical protein
MESALFIQIFRNKALVITHIQIERMLIYLGCKVKKKKVKLSLYRPWRPLRLREVEAPHIFRHSAHRWRQVCQPYAPAAFLPPGRFLVLNLLEAESTPGP